MHKLSLFLTVVASLLAAFNGFLSVLNLLVFTGHESFMEHVFIYLPSALWIAGLVCIKFPKAGFLAYTSILVVCIVVPAAIFISTTRIVVPQIVIWRQHIDNLRFAVAGGILLLANLFVAAKVHQDSSTTS